MSDLKHPEWEERYSEAMLELDPGKLVERVNEAEFAICSRLQELRTNPEAYLERQAIKGAIKWFTRLEEISLRFLD